MENLLVACALPNNQTVLHFVKGNEKNEQNFRNFEGMSGNERVLLRVYNKGVGMDFAMGVVKKKNSKPFNFIRDKIIFCKKL